jgi:hypothetical protein
MLAEVNGVGVGLCTSQRENSRCLGDSQAWFKSMQTALSEVVNLLESGAKTKHSLVCRICLVVLRKGLQCTQGC